MCHGEHVGAHNARFRGDVFSGTPFNSEGNIVKSVNRSELNPLYPLVHNYSK